MVPHFAHYACFCLHNLWTSRAIGPRLPDMKHDMEVVTLVLTCPHFSFDADSLVKRLPVQAVHIHMMLVLACMHEGSRNHECSGKEPALVAL